MLLPSQRREVRVIKNTNILGRSEFNSDLQGLKSLSVGGVSKLELLFFDLWKN